MTKVKVLKKVGFKFVLKKTLMMTFLGTLYSRELQ